MPPKTSSLWQSTTPSPIFMTGEEGLPHTREADIVIIGGGFSGVALAYHLARQRTGQKIVLLEGETLGSGTSGQCGGLLMNGTEGGIFPGTDNLLPLLSEIIERENIPCHLKLNGCYEIDPYTNEFLKWTPGGEFHPLEYLYGLAQKAQSYGATILTKSRVTDISFGNPITLQAGPFSIKTKWLLLATNIRFFPIVGLRDVATPGRTYAIATEPLPPSLFQEIGWHRECPFYMTEEPLLWGRVTHDYRIVMGNGLSALDHVENSRFDYLERTLHELHPLLARVPVEYHWSGSILVSNDVTPRILRAPQNPNILYMGCYAGQGITLSHLFAERVARLVAHNDQEAFQGLEWATRHPSENLQRSA